MRKYFKHSPMAALLNASGQPALTGPQMVMAIVLTAVIILVTLYVKLPLP